MANAEKQAAKAEAKAEKQAAKAEAKAEKQAARAEKQAEKSQVANLKSAQKAELMAYENTLSGQGLSKNEMRSLLKDERLANKDELAAAKEYLGQEGQQYIGLTQRRPDGTQVRGPIVSQMSTIGEEYRDPIVNDLRGALSRYSEFNLPTLTRSGNTTIGFGLDKILKAEYSKDPETGQYGLSGNLGKTLNRAQQFVGNTFTAEELAEQGAKIKQDKQNPGLYTWKFGNDERTGYVFFKDNGDGTFTGVGANRMSVDMPSGALAKTFRSVPFLPEIAAIGASFIPGAQPFVPQIYAAGSGLRTAATGGNLGDVLKSAALAYAGSKVIPGMVGKYAPSALTSIPGFVPGASRAITGVLGGQELSDALRSGLFTGVGGYIGSQIGNYFQSPLAGRTAGALTTTALHGGDIGEALKNMAISGALQTGMEKSGLNQGMSQAIPDPFARDIAQRSLSQLLFQNNQRAPSPPPMPTPVPGSVMRQLSMPQVTQPLRVVAKGGHIKAKRNVSELIPLRRGALSVLRGT
jgi:hypothetical protein